MDDADRAYEMQLRFLEESIAIARRGINPGPSRMFCLNCGERIPEERRRKVEGCDRCVRCQTIVEQLERGNPWKPSGPTGD